MMPVQKPAQLSTALMLLCCLALHLQVKQEGILAGLQSETAALPGDKAEVQHLAWTMLC